MNQGIIMEAEVAVAKYVNTAREIIKNMFSYFYWLMELSNNTVYEGRSQSPGIILF